MHLPATLLHCCTKGPEGINQLPFTQLGENEIAVWIDSYPQVCVSALACLKANTIVTSHADRQQAPAAGSLAPAANPYIELRSQFQEAYAIHGRDYLWLAAVTPEEHRSYPFLQEAYVGVVSLPPSVWYIVGEICHASQFSAGDLYCKLRSATLEVFSGLASRAGAALPVSIRRTIPGYPDHSPVEPLSWWLTFLWHLFPPSDEDLAPLTGQVPPVRIACSEPFQASIDAIESCKLHTDQPRFPSKERRDTITTIDPETMAIALLFKRRDLSLSGIPEVVGVERQTLYKWPRFLEAAEKAGKYNPKRKKGGDLPRGSKAADGTIEAYRDSDLEDD